MSADRTEVNWLSEREQRAWRGFIDMQTQLGAHLRRSLARDSGLSDADYEVLVHLSEAPGDRLRVFELVRALQWEKSRLSHQLRRMEGRGLLQRTECETDGRGAFVALTPEGRAAITAAAPLHVAEVRRHFVDVLSEAQLDSLAEIAGTILARLRVTTEGCGVPGPDTDVCDEETNP
jgi:DNA-binding MarR family transcriptional regulator